MELLERDVALAQLDGLLDAADAGIGRLATVSGEAGIGKSVLMQRLCRSIRERADVLVGRCDPLSTPAPLSPLLDIAPTLGGELERLLHAAAPVRRVFDALLEELSAGPRAHVLILEDAHWADDATLDLIRFLARRLGSTRALLIATYREDEVGPRDPLRIALGDVASANIVRVRLQPLSLEAVTRLAAGTRRDASEVYQRTGGNPFFVTQVLAAPSEAVPTSISDAILARVARLSNAARRALEAAAIAGSRVDPLLVERIGESAPDGLDACAETGLLLPDGAHLVFRHELVREAVLEVLTTQRQIALHRVVLAALVEGGVRDDLLARLAHHAEGARDRAAVLEYAPAAARRATQLGAHREAAAQYARALTQTCRPLSAR